MARRERRYQHINKKEWRQWLIICLVIFPLCWSEREKEREIEKNQAPKKLSIFFSSRLLLRAEFHHILTNCNTHSPPFILNFFLFCLRSISCVDRCLSHYLWDEYQCARAFQDDERERLFFFSIVYMLCCCCCHHSSPPRLLVHFSLCGLFSSFLKILFIF